MALSLDPYTLEAPLVVRSVRRADRPGTTPRDLVIVTDDAHEGFAVAGYGLADKFRAGQKVTLRLEPHEDSDG